MGKNGNEKFKTEKKSREGKIYMHKHIKYRYTFRCCVFIVESKRKKNSKKKINAKTKIRQKTTTITAAPHHRAHCKHTNNNNDKYEKNPTPAIDLFNTFTRARFIQQSQTLSRHIKIVKSHT